VQGVTWALLEGGKQITGFELDVSSNVPIGKGLSSSAALEIAVGRALNVAFGLGLSDVEIAMVGHRAETGFVGAPVGIMDQMVCSLGDRSSALFLDAATREYEKIPLPQAAELAVIDSGIAHAHASGEYRTRRRECDEAAKRLGVDRLRDVTAAHEAEVEKLPHPLNRRARHVVTENARVLAAVDALRRNDVHTLGTLFLQSHASMRDDFQVSLPDIDRLVEIAAEHPDTFGARLTGGGFGGAIVILCRAARAAAVARETVDRFRAETQREGKALLPEMT
jgi:galactokinase